MANVPAPVLLVPPIPVPPLKGTSPCLQLLSAARLGEQVYKGHHSYDLMRNLQLGILFSIAKSGRLSPLGAKRSLDPSDFSMQVGGWW